MMNRLIPLAAIALLLTQCAEESADHNAASEASKPRSMNDRFNSRGKEGYYQDSEGNWKIKNDKRSSFESMGQSSLANRQYSGKTYNPGTVQKKSWWGDTTHAKPAYAGNTSAEQFQTSANATGKTAQEGGIRSLFSRKAVTTTRLDHQTARESSTAEIQRNRASQNETQRSSLEQADIIDWKEQRQLQLKDTKSWLKK
jgi:hypothetical protein